MLIRRESFVQHIGYQMGSCERWYSSHSPCSCLVIAPLGDWLRHCACSLPWDLTVLISGAAHHFEPQCGGGSDPQDRLNR